MSFWTFLFLAMLLAIPLSGIWARHLQQARASSARDADELAELKGELARLRSRTEALEAVVTDRGYRIEQQIDALD